LPAFQFDELAFGGPVALDVGHQLGELANAFSGAVGLALGVFDIRVPYVGEVAGFGAGEIIEVTLASEAVPLASDDLAVDDVTRVGGGDVAEGGRGGGHNCAHWS